MKQRVLIDDRAGSKELARSKPLKDISELTRLDSGDVMLMGNGPEGKVSIGIEVKSIWDFLSSASSGRLMGTQLPAMLETFDHNWLLLYGSWRPGRMDGLLHIEQHGRWVKFNLGSTYTPYSYVEHLITHIEMMGIHVARVYDKRDAAEWIAASASWWAKPWEKHKASRVMDKSGVTQKLRPVKLSPRIRFMAGLAASLPGVGYDRAVAAAEHFDSAEQMMNASYKEWKEVKGIGPVVAKAIVAAMKQARKPS